MLPKFDIFRYLKISKFPNNAYCRLKFGPYVLCRVKPSNKDEIVFLILLGKICAKMGNFKIGALYFSSVIVSIIF